MLDFASKVQVYITGKHRVCSINEIDQKIDTINTTDVFSKHPAKH